jgi:Ribonuclease G/E
MAGVTFVRDGAIGETREVMLEAGRAIAFRVVRWSDEGARARWGEMYAARVRRSDPQRRGMFIDLGLSAHDGFLPFSGRGLKLTDGAGIVVTIAREAARGKGPVVKLAETPFPGGAPRRLERHACDSEFDLAGPADNATRAEIDALIEDCLSPHAAIPGGGVLTIEPTAALIAIDVDAGARQGAREGEAFVLELNRAAVLETARQIRLRSLGGIGAIDLPAMRARDHQQQVVQTFREAVQHDPWGVQAAPLSRFGVLEFSRGQLRTPLHEILQSPGGRNCAETIALAALRAIEREASARGGLRVRGAIAVQAYNWLAGDHIPWRAALDRRIGARWELVPSPSESAFQVQAL